MARYGDVDKYRQQERAETRPGCRRQGQPSIVVNRSGSGLVTDLSKVIGPVTFIFASHNPGRSEGWLQENENSRC